jgi:hypothetical protein
LLVTRVPIYVTDCVHPFTTTHDHPHRSDLGSKRKVEVFGDMKDELKIEEFEVCQHWVERGKYIAHEFASLIKNVNHARAHKPHTRPCVARRSQHASHRAASAHATSRSLPSPPSTSSPTTSTSPRAPRVGTSPSRLMYSRSPSRSPPTFSSLAYAAHGGFFFKRFTGLLERRKRGGGINGLDDKSSGMEILKTEV